MKQPSRRGARALFSDPLLRVIPAGLALIVIVLAFAGLSRLTQKPSPDAIAPAESPVATELTPSPVPTITPTPAVYAPFGAQYGYGGEELIPETPTPAPTPTPTATPRVTATPWPCPAAPRWAG